LSFIKYAKDKQKLQENIAADSSFQSIGKDAIAVINVCTGAKLKQEESEVVDVCQAIQEIAEEAAEKAREEVRAQMRAETEKATALATKEKYSMITKSIKALMDKAGLTLEQSMSALELSENDRKNLIPLI
jgi:predicted transposase YdaD